jgi:uncharacterized repeat protein (TIGR02543 family)
MTIFSKKSFFALMAMFLVSVVFLVGCGKNDDIDPAPSKFTVTFDVQGGSFVSSITADSGSVKQLPIPTKCVGGSGYDFNGWYSAATDGMKMGNGGQNYTITKSITLYAQWTSNEQECEEAIDLLSVNWLNAWAEYVDEDDYGVISLFEKDEGMVEWQADVPQQPSDDDGETNWDIWQNAGVAVYLNNGVKGVFFNNKTKFTLTYSSDDFLEMALDGTANTENGAAYIAILPDTKGEDVTIIFDLSKCTTGSWSEKIMEGDIDDSYYETAGNMHFQLPSWWVDDGHNEFPLDHSKITAIQFNLTAADWGPRDAFVTIKKFEIIDANEVE